MLPTIDATNGTQSEQVEIYVEPSIDGMNDILNSDDSQEGKRGIFNQLDQNIRRKYQLTNKIFNVKNPVDIKGVTYRNQVQCFGDENECIKIKENYANKKFGKQYNNILNPVSNNCLYAVKNDKSKLNNENNFIITNKNHLSQLQSKETVPIKTSKNLDIKNSYDKINLYNNFNNVHYKDSQINKNQNDKASKPSEDEYNTKLKQEQVNADICKYIAKSKQTHENNKRNEYLTRSKKNQIDAQVNDNKINDVNLIDTKQTKIDAKKPRNSTKSKQFESNKNNADAALKHDYLTRSKQKSLEASLNNNSSANNDLIVDPGKNRHTTEFGHEKISRIDNSLANQLKHNQFDFNHNRYVTRSKLAAFEALTLNSKNLYKDQNAVSGISLHHFQSNNLPPNSAENDTILNSVKSKQHPCISENIYDKSKFLHEPLAIKHNDDFMFDITDLNKYYNINIHNIDADDHGLFPQYNVYVNNVYKYLYSLEKYHQLPKDFIKNQANINERMRCILVDWMLQVQNRFRMVPETIELSVRILDKYLYFEQVQKEKLQLVGTVCLLIAAKYEETYHPDVEDLIKITNQLYTIEDIVLMERSILNRIGFDLSCPIPISFLRRFSKAVGATNRTHKMAKFFLELALLDCKLTNLLPSILAASSLYLATILLEECEWNDTSVFYSTYTKKELFPYTRLIASHVYKVSQSAVKTTIKKYSGQHYDCLSYHSCFKSQTFKSLLPISLQTQ